MSAYNLLLSVSYPFVSTLDYVFSPYVFTLDLLFSASISMLDLIPSLFDPTLTTFTILLLV